MNSEQAWEGAKGLPLRGDLEGCNIRFSINKIILD
jgi:hypothetical protein